jgi:hypothetical protein
LKIIAAEILIPDRIRWNTAYVIPLSSNIFYAIKLKSADNTRECAEKTLVLWLNTTWGLLTVLINRQETRGRWTRLKMAQWRLLQVLDVMSLDSDTLKRLADIFDKYAEKPLRRIPEQFSPEDPDPVRLGIDKDFIKVLNPSIDEKSWRKV